MTKVKLLGESISEKELVDLFASKESQSEEKETVTSEAKPQDGDSLTPREKVLFDSLLHLKNAVESLIKSFYIKQKDSLITNRGDFRVNYSLAHDFEAALRIREGISVTDFKSAYQASIEKEQQSNKLLTEIFHKSLLDRFNIDIPAIELDLSLIQSGNTCDMVDIFNPKFTERAKELC